MPSSDAGTTHGLRPIAVGFSNGAIMTAALMMTYPDLLGAAVLLRPLSPFAVPPSSRLSDVPVLVVDGAKDHRRSQDDGPRLADTLRRAGADVTHEILPVGHDITTGDERIAREWLRAVRSGTARPADGR